MKKISLFKILLLILSISGTTAFAQAKNDLAVLNRSHRIKTIPMTEGFTSISSEKAHRTFNSVFQNASDITWSTYGKDLHSVYFKTPGKAHRCRFDKKGNIVATFTTYSEEFLPAAILLMVKEEFYGKRILGITEVNYDGKTAYLIILEDRTTLTHIKVVGDEMEIENTYIKG